MTTVITVAFGDGVGPEIMEAALHVMREAGAQLEIETIEIGSRIYNMEGASGLLPSAWNSLLRTKTLLKGPIIVPEDKKFQSVTDAVCGIFEMEDANRSVHRHEGNPDIAAATHITPEFALFEVLQEPMPQLAGKNKADPSGAILAGVLLLEHIGQTETAERIRQAWQQALSEDLRLGTQEFAAAVVERLPIASLSPLMYNPAL